jgi:hypothetical protein
MLYALQKISWEGLRHHPNRVDKTQYKPVFHACCADNIYVKGIIVRCIHWGYYPRRLARCANAYGSAARS